MKLKNVNIRGYITIVIFIFAWEFFCRLKILDPVLIPSFSKVITGIGELFLKQKLLYHIELSFYRSFLGFLLSIIIAVPLGIAISILVKQMQSSVELVLDACSQINPFIVYHLIIIILGVGEFTQIVVITWTCIWPILFSTITGILNVDDSYIKHGKSFALNKWDFISKILLPGALPQIMHGVKLSLNYSLFMLIAAEMMGGSSGLGFLIKSCQNMYRVDWVIGIVIVIAMIGLLMDSIVMYLENKNVYLKYILHEKE
ncbi:ABC transporter permease [Clostridium beijerinckii]|uniref:ABC transporter permease n=2 Tax=Clostridium beijerinckii TaxID=1520 RepID=A0AAE2RNM8_CLOBE|nr:ABC transporter permease [Clostridium beijerinckii]ABR32805.1 binding-protein-dependent transport systems inner membrane component [Clostridium beijerinckii NCIMB 8052]AIU01971.1 binding-protein-dependent transport systems inner membrane component [Clostridium beijerinckii ATCC 35702]MBF7807516.1 ABC transporter permease [Clostridium beijerinckii]NRT25959.1 NitT/TauT family transport system permease protein [Clostridium beijerinckii]NRT66441.1 NitT/TauT family transport system permease prot